MPPTSLRIISTVIVAIVGALSADAVNIVEKVFTGQEIVDNWYPSDDLHGRGFPNSTNYNPYPWPDGQPVIANIYSQNDHYCCATTNEEYNDVRAVKVVYHPCPYRPYSIPRVEVGADNRLEPKWVNYTPTGWYFNNDSTKNLLGYVRVTFPDVASITPITLDTLIVRYDADRRARQMAWSADKATATLGQDFASPNLTGDCLTGVTYSSSNPSVAVINYKGEITLCTAGETTITASCPETNAWQAAMTSYTLAVAEPEGSSSLTVNVATPGTLRTLLVDLDEVPTSMKLTGSLNSADLAYINKGTGSMARVANLDLSEISLSPDNGPYASKVIGRTDVGIGDITIHFYLSNECRTDTTAGGNGVTAYVNYNCYTNTLAGLFVDNPTLRSVAMPTWLGVVGQYTFRDSKVSHVAVPPSATAIEREAFRSAGALAYIELPATVESIGQSAFAESGLAVVTLPQACKTIGESAFKGTHLSEINLSHVAELGARAFAETDLAGTLTLPQLEAIPDWCFASCHIASVNFAPGLRAIGATAFAGNKELTSVSLPDGLESIGSEAFGGCPDYMSLNIPESVIMIGRNSVYVFLICILHARAYLLRSKRKHPTA